MMKHFMIPQTWEEPFNTPKSVFCQQQLLRRFLTFLNLLMFQCRLIHMLDCRCHSHFHIDHIHTLCFHVDIICTPYILHLHRFFVCLFFTSCRETIFIYTGNPTEILKSNSVALSSFETSGGPLCNPYIVPLTFCFVLLFVLIYHPVSIK